MLRGFEFMAFLRTLGPLVAVAVASLAAVPPQAARANSVIQVRPVVALASPVKDSDAFMAAAPRGNRDLRGLGNSQGSVLVRWVFGVAEPAAVTSSDRTLGPVMRYIVVADVDPNFERWQKDADEKLKDETARKIVKQHPLADAQPGKAVVVCEAGCRTQHDEVVYAEPIVLAVLPESKFEPSSSAPPPVVDDGAMPCIAGCYERPQRKTAGTYRSAELAADVPSTPASLITGALQPIALSQDQPANKARQQFGHNGAIVALDARVRPFFVRRAVMKSKTYRSTTRQEWSATLFQTAPPKPRRVRSVRAITHALRRTRLMRGALMMR